MSRKFLQQLYRAGGGKRRRKLIANASVGQLNCVRNLCYHLCKGKYRLPEKVRRKILPYRKDIRDLANKKKLKSKSGLKRRLIMRGGFLGALLPLVLGLLSPVIQRAIGV